MAVPVHDFLGGLARCSEFEHVLADGTPTTFKLAKLGEGAFGVVVCVRRKADGALFALKCIRQPALSAPGVRDAVMSEFKLMMKIPAGARGLVRAHDAWTANIFAYVLMDLCELGSVSEVIEEANFGIADAGPNNVIARDNGDMLLTQVSDMVAGMCVLEEHNVVHLDLKPANVMLAAGGQARVVDFGLAVMALSANGTIGRQRVGCTPIYASPELALVLSAPTPPDRTHVNGRSDMYALGLIIHELLWLNLPRALEDAARDAMRRAEEQTNLLLKAVSELPQLCVPDDLPDVTPERAAQLIQLVRLLLRREVQQTADVSVHEVRPDARAVRHWMTSKGLWRTRQGYEAYGTQASARVCIIRAW